MCRLIRAVFLYSLLAVLFLTSCTATKHHQGGIAATSESAENAENQESYAPAPNCAEREIMSQAILTGVIAGAVIGAVADKLLGTSGLFTLVGATLGGATGKYVGDEQLSKIQDLQLEEARLQALLKASEDYNESMREINVKLESDFQELKLREEKERQETATKHLVLLEQQSLNLQKAIEERKKLSAALIQKQKEQYEVTLRELEEEKDSLDVMIDEARYIAETGHLGTLSQGS